MKQTTESQYCSNTNAIAYIISMGIQEIALFDIDAELLKNQVF